MNKILTLFHYLLWYPDELFQDHLDQLQQNIAGLADSGINVKINSLIDSFKAMSLTSIEELYSQTFDFNTTHCQYLGYYLFGETYFRSNFLSNLLDVFKKFNYLPSVSDLPDHLVILLEFTATNLIGNDQKEFLDSIIITALNKMLHISEVENEKEKDYFNIHNPYFSLLTILYEYLTSYVSKEIILTTI